MQRSFRTGSAGACRDQSGKQVAGYEESPASDCRDHYFDYKPNTRETIRRQTLHQFEQARIVDRNRDDPDQPTNSRDNNYSLTAPVVAILKAYPDGDWRQRISAFKASRKTLQEQYERDLVRHRIPARFPDGREFTLSPGRHNQLHADIADRFCSRFIGKAGTVLYLGDTASSRQEGGKFMHLEAERLKALGVPPMSHEKLPDTDMVIHDEDRKWLFLIEAVTSHGPVSKKRWTELEESLRSCTVGRIYVTAFPTAAEFRRHAADIAWETEVWIAEDPDHMIHYNGDRFPGPHGSDTGSSY